MMPLDDAEHRQVIAELDVLLVRVAGLLQRFETLGQTETQRADYLALHDLQARILLQRAVHRQALDAPQVGDEPATLAGADGVRH